MALLGDDSVVLAATSKGSVKSFTWPVVIPRPKGDPPVEAGAEFRLHAATAWGITSMVLLNGKGLLFTSK